jgi:hypothetical protein
LRGEAPEDDGAKGPKPELIPANERRRAPLPVRLAVESSSQAVAASGLKAEELPSVFVSGLGDTQLTDYMCRALSSEHKALSPTKFHNSVHNAAAGYWTISTGCMQAANSIAAFQESASLALMEAAIQCETENRPVLITYYDAPVAAPLKGMLQNEMSFSVSLVIAPAKPGEAGALTATVNPEAVEWPTISGAAELVACYQSNPAARILAFTELLLDETRNHLALPLSAAISLQLARIATAS